MAKGIWRKRIDALVDDAEAESKSGIKGLSNAERHHEILREKILFSLRASIKPPMRTAAKYHNEVSKQIDAVVDVLVENSEKDGMDLDGEMLNLLTDISGKLFAVEKTWDDIHDLLN